ncbi:MAG: helix-turn-helix domain-containing protein [Oscillospiraceae bacterium]|nr:helix-turn-helix domain-containing protein [Oscillospiraceae bacterium]
MSTGNVSDWKSRRSKPNIDTLPKIADYFDVSVDYLLGRTDNPKVNR